MPPYHESRCLSYVKSFFHCEGLQLYVKIAITGAAVIWSTVSIFNDIIRDEPHNPSWNNYFKITAFWFVFNVSTMLFLGLIEGPTWGVVEPQGSKFKLFPLFSWQTPAIQQICFFWPAALFILKAFLTGSSYYQVPAHGVASLFGQQTRELILFDSDMMMVIHHVVTMFLSGFIWYGMAGFCDGNMVCDRHDMIGLNGMSVAALEAGGLGCCIWSMFETKRGFFWVLTLSHALCLAAGWYCMFMDPSVKFFYVTFVLSIPLIYSRQKYMLAEVSNGSPSGAFDRDKFDAKTGDKEPKKAK